MFSRWNGAILVFESCSATKKASENRIELDQLIRERKATRRGIRP